jgi:peptidoglycan hydrolase-like protein with peptidoglycan-binding domain
MKKIYVSIIGMALLLGALSPITVGATSNNGNASSAAEILANLQAQIKLLNDQMANLRTQLEAANKIKNEIKNTTNEIKESLHLARTLKAGMSGDDIKTLQELLATDSDVYPEGLITGYYGKATERAVKRLQKKFCLDQVGHVGPLTLKKINELLQEGAGNSGEHSSNASNSIHVPAGLLKASGILKKLCGNSTTTPDTTAPTSSAITVSNITVSSAKVKWTTNEFTSGKVWYSTTNGLTATSPASVAGPNNLTFSHEVTLTGLATGTTYYYIVVSTDASGNKLTSAQQSFMTLAAPDTTAPVISEVIATGTNATSAIIKWTTNELANSLVTYNKEASVLVRSNSSFASSSLYTLSHELTLTNLTPTTTYYYVVQSKDQSGNLNYSTEKSFTTSGN